MINKISPSIADALSSVRDGHTVLIGGFGTSGTPISPFGLSLSKPPRQHRARTSPGAVRTDIPAGRPEPVEGQAQSERCS